MAGYVQVNGVTFETPEASDGRSAEVLAAKLLGGVPGLGDVVRVIVVPTEGRASTTLAVNTSRVWGVAAWFEA